MPSQPSSQHEAAKPPPVALMSRSGEVALFGRLRRMVLSATLRQQVSTARLRMTLAILLSIAFWLGVYLLVGKGLRFVREGLPPGADFMDIVRIVFNLFYGSLSIMLIFSSGIILYGGLYRTPEVKFLLTTPASEGRIFSYKFQEAMFFSSWGFLLLGSPMLVAFGTVSNSPWYYYLLMFPFMIAFVFVPTGIGAIACLITVNYLSKLRMHLGAMMVALVGASSMLLLWWLFSMQKHDPLSAGWLNEVSGFLRVFENRLLPSWWLSSGMLEASRRDTELLDYSPLAQSLMFLSLLVSNALLFHQFAGWIARRILRASYSRIQTAVGDRRRRRVLWLDRLVPRLLPFFPYQIRLLIVKDLRIFRRDPLQWSQLLIFFGLLAMYFLNVQSSSFEDPPINSVNVVSFLYLAVVGLILSTFTTRFVFPMISLEGRRFWVLGLLPLDRRTILWGKFVFSTVGSAIPCALLILLSDMVLNISFMVTAIHQLTCILLCVGLSGIAVGMGAKMPDLRETSPSKIAAGFGGTLNLVVSAIYIVLIVGLTAVPCHFYVIAESTGAEGLWDLEELKVMVVSGILGALVIGVAATWIPLWAGFKAFEKLEF